MLFRDDILKTLLDRQIAMQYAYEQQLAAARLQLHEALSQQMLDQDSVEGKVQKLVLRERTLETRAAAVAELVERFAPNAGAASTRNDEPPTVAPPRQTTAESLPSPPSPKPRPEEWDLRLGEKVDTDAPPRSAERAALANAADSRLPMEARLVDLALSLDRVEREQASRLAAVARPATAAANRLRRVFDIAGLPIERFVTPAPKAALAMGGPYIAADAPNQAIVFRARSRRRAGGRRRARSPAPHATEPAAAPSAERRAADVVGIWLSHRSLPGPAGAA